MLVVLLAARIQQTHTTTGRQLASTTYRPRIDITALDGAGLLRQRLSRSASGETTLLELSGGRPLLVNLWAQSCVPCVTEMPMLERAHQSTPEVAFVGVDVLDERDRAAEMARQTGITYPWVLDPAGSWAARARTTNIPTTLLFDAKGVVVAAKVGAFHSDGEIRRWIRRGLGETP